MRCGFNPVRARKHNEACVFLLKTFFNGPQLAYNTAQFNIAAEGKNVGIHRFD